MDLGPSNNLVLRPGPKHQFPGCLIRLFPGQVLHGLSWFMVTWVGLKLLELSDPRLQVEHVRAKWKKHCNFE